MQRARLSPLLLASGCSSSLAGLDAGLPGDGGADAATDAGIIGALFALNLDGSVFQPCADDVGLVH